MVRARNRSGGGGVRACVRALNKYINRIYSMRAIPGADACGADGSLDPTLGGAGHVPLARLPIVRRTHLRTLLSVGEILADFEVKDSKLNVGSLRFCL